MELFLIVNSSLLPSLITVPIGASTVNKFFLTFGAPQIIFRFCFPSKTSQILNLSAFGCFFTSNTFDTIKFFNFSLGSKKYSTSRPILVNLSHKFLFVSLKLR